MTSDLTYPQDAFTIIGSPSCTYCTRAKTYLDAQERDYVYFDIEDYPWLVPLLVRANLKKVPQIFSPSGSYIGGYDDLVDYLNEEHL